MQRFLILTNGRSGSNYFVQVLNQHPHLANYGEVLGPWMPTGRFIRPLFTGEDGPARFLDWLYASRAAFAAAQAYSFVSRKRAGKPTHFRRYAAVKALGIKEFTVNFERYGLEDYLRDRPDIRLVTLVRENPLERFVSSRMLGETGSVARTGEGSTRSDTAQIRLAPDRLISDLDVVQRENDAVRAVAAGHDGPVFEMTYEGFFRSSEEEQRATLNELQRFIGVEPAKLTAEHRKLRVKPLSETIANYEDVETTLRGTPYHDYLR